MKQFPKRRQVAFLVAFLCVVGFQLCASDRDLSSAFFRELMPEDSSPLTQVNRILQGPEGFVWIASSRGALRYDGYEIRPYTSQKGDPGSINNDSVWTLFLDSKRRLWLGTHLGASRYLPNTDSFRNYLFRLEGAASDHRNRCNTIIEDANGRILATAENGLIYRYDEAADRFTPLNPDAPLNTIKSMAVAPDGTLWLGSESMAYAFDPETLEVESFTEGFEAPDGAPANFLYEMVVVSDDEIWFGTAYSGIVSLDPRTGVAVPFAEQSKNELRVHGLLRNCESTIWACHLDGITLYDKATRRRVLEFGPEPEKGGLPVGTYTNILVDDQQNIWAGTYKQGLYVSINNKAFNAIAPDVAAFGPGLRPMVNRIFVDSKDRTWYGFAFGGIQVLNSDGTLAFNLVPDEDDPGALDKNDVYEIKQARDGTLWVATYNGGLRRFEEESRSFKRYAHDPDDTKSIGGNDIRAIVEDQDGALWLALKGAGISRFDPASGTAQNFAPDPQTPQGSLLNRWTSDIEIGADGIIYVATPDGLSALDPSTGSVENYRADPDNPNSLAQSYCNDLFLDSRGQIWVGTNNGIGRFDAQDRNFENYRPSEGMPANQVLAIHEDLDGFIWAGTNDGLARIDPESGEIKSFDTLDGLAYNGFIVGSVFRDQRGRLHFGQKRGVTRFDPRKISENKRPPPVLISDVKLNFNSLTQQAYPADPERRLFHLGADSVTIDYDSKVLTFGYVAINYIQTPKNQYAYRLIGFDNDWVYAGARREANYTNLNPGTYTFQVKASNNDGYWNEQGASLTVIIPPPFWKSREFYVALVIGLPLLAWLLVRLRERQLLQDRKILEEAVASRTETIQQQNKELEIQRNTLAQNQDKLEETVAERTAEYLRAKVRAEDADRLKSSFLANLSHEIRTPLNAVVGFSSLLRTGVYSDTDREEFTEVIEANSKSLLRLIDDILDLSMIESNQISIQEEGFSLNRFIENTGQSHAMTFPSETVAFSVSNRVADRAYELVSDQQRVRQIVDNLLVNAAKFTDRGRIQLVADATETHLQIAVFDTGKGISPKHQARIFDQFYRIQEDEQMAKRGVGLGLAICKRLALLLGGDLTLESTKGVGSTFTFSLPIAKARATSTQSPQAKAAVVETGFQDYRGKRVLVVEDEETNFQFLKVALSRHRIEVVWAETGQKGVELFKTGGAFDLVFLDLKLPGMNGFEVLAELRKADPSCRVIAQTAFAMKSDQVQIWESGFSDYLSKPIALQELQSTLARHLGACSSIR